jgi:hypothetical protein
MIVRWALSIASGNATTTRDDPATGALAAGEGLPGEA